MWHAEVSIDIAAPAEDVYQYLSDFRRHKEWATSVAEIEQLSGGDIGVGTEFKATETVPARFVSYSRVTALEQPQRISWDAWDNRMMKTQWEFELSPTDGRTHLVQRCRFQPTNLLGTLVFNVMRRRRIPKENQQSLERIKWIMEGGAH